MRVIDVTSILVGLIGIVVTLYSLNSGKAQIKDASSFYEYRLLSEKTLMKNLKRVRLAKIIFLYSILFFPNFEKSFDVTGVLTNEFLDYCKVINSLIMAAFVCASFVYTQFVAFMDSKWINSIIESGRVSKDSIMEKRDKLFWRYWLISLIAVVCAFLTNRNMLDYCLYVVVLVWISIDSLYCIYMFTYLNLRLQFRVSEINVKVKQNSKPYRDVYNYLIQNGQLAVMVKACGVLKKYLFPEYDLEYIEKIIDEENTLLSTEYKDWIIERKKCNR